MLKILVNSYACCPNMGSEPGMGWNWIVNLAKYCEVYVITEGEYKDKVEDFIRSKVQEPQSSSLPTDAPERFAERMHFYWNPVTPEVRKMCWNQGDWRFYKYYREWQKKTAEIARNIINDNYNDNENINDTPNHGIDVLHQLNMIGFREPGYLWQVSKETGIPFVWGPIGGLKQFPMAYTDGGGLKMKLFNWIKNTINIYQIKHDKRVAFALKQASALISSIPDSYDAIKKYHGLESVVIPETGCEVQEFESSRVQEFLVQEKSLTILWVGKFDFRKRLDIALKAIAEMNRGVKLYVYGAGNEDQTHAALRMAEDLNIDDKVHFMGNRPNDEVKKAMLKADLFLFTSVSEDTSTVVLEAISNNLPVLCFDACGMAAVIDETVGRKIPLTNPSQSVHDFAEQLRYFYDNRDELVKLKEGCYAKSVELSWDSKAKKMLEIYKSVVNTSV